MIPHVPQTPELDAKPCGDSVCITVRSTIDLARYILEIHEIQIALSGCSLVRFE